VEDEQHAIEKYLENIETELAGENKLLINELAESLFAEEEITRCQNCGVTLSEKYELEDERCANCQAELDKENPDVKIV
jgi:protein-arginine kinase activator protein McsA